MASGKTANLELNQWTKTDPVCMEEFNADNRKIDEAIGEVKQVAESGTKLYFGNYTGTGTSSRTITIGATPKVVVIWTANGAQYDSYSRIVQGGICGTGNPCKNSGTTAFEIVNNGFSVKQMDSAYVSCNYSGSTYYYMALV